MNAYAAWHGSVKVPEGASGELSLAVEAVLTAGQITRQKFDQAVNIEEKAGDIGLVTEADHEAEAAIVSILRAGSPHGILAEEGGFIAGSKEACWVIDPLDGTTNFARGLPLFAVSLALMSGNEAKIGVILDVMNGRLAIAERGLGAYADSGALRLCRRDKGKPVIFINSGYRREDEERAAVLTRQLAGRCSVRKLGSTALELSYVASGRADAFMSAGDELWDFAAGICLVREAGGKVVDWKGRDWESGTFVLAGEPSVVDELLQFTAKLQPSS